MSRRPAFASVSDYLSALAPAQARALKRALAVVRNAVPGITRVISYGIPAFRQERVFIYCAAFERHIGIYPPVTDDARLKAALAPYANAKGNLSFPLDVPLPMALIGRVAKALARQYASTSVARPKPRARKSRSRATTVRRPAPGGRSRT
jgi:uncharacterized protein YdhG (YjbR/CyaY superfamily)